jgi:hypothetical protein
MEEPSMLLPHRRGSVRLMRALCGSLVHSACSCRGHVSPSLATEGIAPNGLDHALLCAPEPLCSPLDLGSRRAQEALAEQIDLGAPKH